MSIVGVENFKKHRSLKFGSVGKDSTDIIKELGFKASLSCSSGVNFITKDENCLYVLKRNNRPAGITTEKFFQKLLE